MTPDQLRNEIPLLSQVVYLDSASVCPPPKEVLAAVDDYYKSVPLNYGVGNFRASREASRRVDWARSTLADFIGAADSSEVVFTKNTTEALNTVCEGLDLMDGDEVILTSLEHQSNLLPWFRLAAERGVKVRIAHPDSSGRVTAAAIEQHLSDNTRLVAVTHVSNVLGTIQPVEEIAALLRPRDVIFLVDAAQSAGRLPVDVSRVDCDFMAFCGRKSLMGPQGTGFLWGRAERLEKLRPLTLGSRAANAVSAGTWQLNPYPYRFEAGVLNTGGVIGLGAAVSLLGRIGMGRVQTHLAQLAERMIDGLQSIDGVAVYGVAGRAYQAGIVSWCLDGVPAHQVAASLDDIGGVAVASGEQGSRLAMDHLGVREVVRSSVYYFNTLQDIDHLLLAVKQLTDP